MTTNNEDFTKALRTEADLAEALLGVVSDKQKAILAMKGESIAALSRREEELVGLLRSLEVERTKIAASLPDATKRTMTGRMPDPPRIHDVLQRMEGNAAATARKDVSRLRTAVEKITAVNANNRTLLQHSLRFVNETLKLVTDDNRRKIVDARI